MADGRWMPSTHGIQFWCKEPMFAFSITIIRQHVLYIPFLLIFDSVWGYTGLIHAQPAEEFVCMSISLSIMFFYLGRRMDSH